MQFRLDNGLEVLLYPDDSKPTTTVNVTYKVGSRHENYGETGMAHLLEHLMFKGTPRNPDIDKQLNARGARSNGTTWLDRTPSFEIIHATADTLRRACAVHPIAALQTEYLLWGRDPEEKILPTCGELGIAAG